MDQELNQNAESAKVATISARKAELLSNFDSIIASAEQKQADTGGTDALRQEKETTEEAKAEQVDSKKPNEDVDDTSASKITSLLTKFQKKEATFRKEKENLRKENESLKAQIAEIADLKKKLASMEKDPAGYLLNRKDLGEIYEKVTDHVTGRQQPVTQDLVDKRVNELLEQERQARRTIEQRLEMEQREKAIADYKNNLSKVSQDEKYALARDFYADGGTDIASEALTYAEVYATRFGQAIDPAEAIEAVAKLANKSVEIASKLVEKKKKEKPEQETKPKQKTLTQNGKVGAPSGANEVLSVRDRRKALLDEIRRGVFTA